MVLASLSIPAFHSIPRGLLSFCSAKDWCCDVDTQATSGHVGSTWYQVYCSEGKYTNRNNMGYNPCFVTTQPILFRRDSPLFVRQIRDQHVGKFDSTISVCTGKSPPWGTRRDVSHLSRFTPRSREGDVLQQKVFSPFGVTLPTSDIAFFNLCTNTIIPVSSKSRNIPQRLEFHGNFFSQ